MIWLDHNNAMGRDRVYISSSAGDLGRRHFPFVFKYQYLFTISKKKKQSGTLFSEPQTVQLSSVDTSLSPRES